MVLTYVSPRRPSLGPAAPESRPGHLASATLASQPPATVPAPPRFQPGLPARPADRLRPHARPLHPVRARPRRGRATEPVPLERVCHHHGKDQAARKDRLAAQDAAQGRKSHPEGTRQSFSAYRAALSPRKSPPREQSVRLCEERERLTRNITYSQSMGIMPTFGISVPGSGREQ